jgi:hypothetical protein
MSARNVKIHQMKGEGRDELISMVSILHVRLSNERSVVGFQ